MSRLSNHSPVLLRALAISSLILGSVSALAQPEFSLDSASPSVSSVGSADILGAGVSGGPPVVSNSAAGLGLAPGDELDAMTSPSSLGTDAAPLGLLHLSVDRASVGVLVSLDDIAESASYGQAAGDIYVSATFGYNNLAYNQDALGLARARSAGDRTHR